MRVSRRRRLEFGDVRAAHVPLLGRGGDAGDDREVIHVGSHDGNLERLVVEIRAVVPEDAAERDVIASLERVRPNHVHKPPAVSAVAQGRAVRGVRRRLEARAGAARQVGRLELVPVLVVLVPSVGRVRRDARDEGLDVRADVVPRVHRRVGVGAPLRVVQSTGPARRLVDPDAIVLIDPGAGTGEGTLAAAPAEIGGQPRTRRPLNLVEPGRLPVPARSGHLRVAVVPRDANLRPAPLLAVALGHILEAHPPRVIARDGEREQRPPRRVPLELRPRGRVGGVPLAGLVEEHAGARGGRGRDVVIRRVRIGNPGIRLRFRFRIRLGFRIRPPLRPSSGGLLFRAPDVVRAFFLQLLEPLRRPSRGSLRVLLRRRFGGRRLGGGIRIFRLGRFRLHGLDLLRGRGFRLLDDGFRRLFRRGIIHVLRGHIVPRQTRQLVDGVVRAELDPQPLSLVQQGLQPLEVVGVIEFVVDRGVRLRGGQMRDREEQCQQQQQLQGREPPPHGRSRSRPNGGFPSDRC